MSIIGSIGILLVVCVVDRLLNGLELKTKLRIAIVENPNPLDQFEERSEATALSEVCRLMGHQVITYHVRSSREFFETLTHLATVDSSHASNRPKAPFVLHISCHGNKDLIAIGQDEIGWPRLAQALDPFVKNQQYLGDLLISLSSCGSAGHKLHHILEANHKASGDISLPPYIFSLSQDEAHWDQTLMAWSLLYLKLSRTELDRPSAIRKALDEIYKGTNVSLRYHRLKTDGSYIGYTGKSKAAT